tara:strand:- start:1835 stop:2563 length:729 start_codon:yes stop_codon:yes gene_type:complete
MVVKMSENLINILVSGSTGKMGQSLIETLSQKKNKDDSVYGILEIVPFNFIENKEIWGSSIIIDFSEPSFSIATLEQAVIKKIPMIIGTTGFDEEQEKIIKEASKQIPLVLAPNTSLGITLLKEMLSSVKNYLVSHKIEILEKHHKDKKDLPSGTSKDITKFIENSLFDRKVLIESLREDSSAGEHSVSIIKDNEVLTISHKVTNRSVYSEGALLAAVWLNKKRGSSGLYQMSDIYVPFEDD